MSCDKQPKAINRADRLSLRDQRDAKEAADLSLVISSNPRESIGDLAFIAGEIFSAVEDNPFIIMALCRAAVDMAENNIDEWSDETRDFVDELERLSQ